MDVSVVMGGGICKATAKACKAASITNWILLDNLMFLNYYNLARRSVLRNLLMVDDVLCSGRLLIGARHRRLIHRRWLLIHTWGGLWVRGLLICLGVRRKKGLMLSSVNTILTWLLMGVHNRFQIDL